MATAAELKEALRRAGFEPYRTAGDSVVVAERVRENLIMDSGVRVGGAPLAVVLTTRAQKADFPGEPAEQLFDRARRAGDAAVQQGYREVASFVTELRDPGDAGRLLDTWYQVELAKQVTTVADAMGEIGFALALDKTARR